MILLIDTSRQVLHVGIATNEGTLIAERVSVASKNERGIHDARLGLAAQEILMEAGAAPADIRIVSLVIGPGSFTGLRIGLAFAKGFCFGSETGIVAMSRHDLLGLAAEEKGLRPDFFVTQGYQSDLLYVKPSAPDAEIELMSVVEFRALAAGLRVVGPESEKAKLEQIVVFDACESGLSHLAAATISGAQVFYGDQISELEPLYVAQFVGSSRNPLTRN